MRTYVRNRDLSNPVSREGLLVGMILEYSPFSSIFDQIVDSNQDYQRFEAKRVVRIAKDVIDGLYQLHSNRILHRDLKPENVIAINAQMFKIIDMDSVFELKENQVSEVTTEDYTTHAYIDP